MNVRTHVTTVWVLLVFHRASDSDSNTTNHLEKLDSCDEWCDWFEDLSQPDETKEIVQIHHTVHAVVDRGKPKC